MVFKLSFKEKTQLKIHTKVCEVCARYEKQSIQLDHLIREHLHSDATKNDINIRKNDKLKDQIIKSLDDF